MKSFNVENSKTGKFHNFLVEKREDAVSLFKEQTNWKSIKDGIIKTEECISEDDLFYHEQDVMFW